MITTNNPGGNNYDGPLWSPHLKWDKKDDYDEEMEKFDKDRLYDDYSDPYGGH